MHKISKAALLGALCLLPATAFAETVTTLDDTIVVTATKTPTEVDRLPARVEVIDRADIEAQDLTTLPQALGASAIQSGGVGAATSFFIRGANSNHALALFDGIRINDASTPAGAYNFGLDTLASIDRIEIVRGPLSTLYGTDAIGGVVNIIPRRGGESAFAPYAEAEVGSFETRRALLGAAGTTNGLSYGATAESYDTEGFDQIPKRMSTRTGEGDGANIDTYTASARWENATFGVDLVARQRDGVVEYDNGFPRSEANLQQETDQTLWRLGADTHLTSNFVARVSGGNVDGDSKDFTDGTLGNHNHFSRNFADASLRWSADNLGVLVAPTLTAGFDWERETASITGGFNDPLSQNQSRNGVYVAAQSGFGHGLSATASARFDNDEGFGAHDVYALGLVSDLSEFNLPVRLFASYGTAFHAPSLSERFSKGFFSVPSPDLKPEESESWEIGADVTAIQDVLSASVSYYETNIDDLITSTFNGSAFQNVNINSAEIKGVEAKVQYTPVSWLELTLAYDYTHTADLSTSPEQPLARRPENVWRVGAVVHATNKLDLALNWSWVSKRWDFDYDDNGNDMFPRSFINPYNVGNLAATYDITDQIQLFGRVDNLTDEEYEPTAGYAASPRAAYFGVRYRPAS